MKANPNELINITTRKYSSTSIRIDGIKNTTLNKIEAP